MKVAICDDEEIFIKSFTGTLKKQNEITDIYGYLNPQVLLTDVESGHEFDIIFMDIKLSENGKNGIEYAEDICRKQPKTQIVFVTGYVRYSQDIFQRDINLCGFLLKKVDIDKLSHLIQKAKDNINSFDRDCLVVVNKKTTYAIPYKQIIYFESKAHTIIVHTYDKEIITYGKLDKLAASLPSDFTQCHKSYLVNMNSIARIEGYKLMLTKGISIPISRARYQDTYQGFFKYVKAKM